MFDRFTDKVMAVISRARMHEQNLRHDFIGTEHIFLGLLDQENSRACAVIQSFGLQKDAIRKEITKNIVIGPELTGFGSGVLPFTPRTKKVLDFAREYANDCGHNHIGTCHLLYGLIRENDGVAAQILTDLGITAKEVDRRICELYEKDKIKGTCIESCEHSSTPEDAALQTAEDSPKGKKEDSRKLTFANLLIGQKFILHHSSKVSQDPVFYIHEPVFYIKVSKCNAISVVTEIETIDLGAEVIHIK